MRIRGSGRLDGEAEIVLMLNGKPYKTEKMKGNIKFTWGGDWYADSITLIYRPLNVESGILILEYWFNDIKEKTANRHVHRIASKSGPR